MMSERRSRKTAIAGSCSAGPEWDGRVFGGLRPAEACEIVIHHVSMTLVFTELTTLCPVKSRAIGVAC